MRATAAAVAALVTATALVGATSATTATAGAAGARRVTLEVSAAALTTVDGLTAPVVSPRVVGANARWVDDELGAWDPESDQPADGFIAAATRAHLGLVRYPGGTIANLFDFTKAIGPQEQRGCQTSGGFAAPTLAPLTPEQNTFGPDEEQRLVRSIGAKTMIMVPSINQSARDAANFVEYMNGRPGQNRNGGTDWAQVRAENGHPKPYGIRYWEYGNEPYGPKQRYWRAVDVDERAHDFVFGGYERQTADSPAYTDNDGLFTGCDLLHRVTGSGAPDQRYRTRYRPIALPSAKPGATPVDEPVVTVGGRRWTRVGTLSSAGPRDHVFAVDAAAGVVRFGDGTHGAVPPKAAPLAVDYTTGRQDGFLDFQRAMKAVDPHIQVCAGYAKPEFIRAIGTHPFDCLGVHSYTNPAGGDSDGAYPSAQLYDELMKLSAAPTDELVGLREQLAQHYPRRSTRPDLVVTEYGTLAATDGPSQPRNFEAMLMHDVYESSLLVGQVNNGVRLSINSNLNNRAAEDPTKRDWAQLLASPPGFLATGRAQALSLATALVGERPHRVRLEGNPQLDGGSYPALVATGTRDARTVTVLVVNRDPSEPVPFRLPAGGPVTSARLTTVTGDDIASFNTDRSSPVRTSTAPLRTAGRTVRGVLPPRSTSLVVIRLAG